MRIQQHLQERHLAESVRRGVITEDQWQAILGVARSMSSAEGAAPDLGWVALVQGLAAAGAIAATGSWLAQDLDVGSPVTQAIQFGLAALVAGLLGFALRRRASTRLPAAVLLAGATALTWGVGFAVATFALRGYMPDVSAGDHWQLAARIRSEVYVVANLTVVVAALGVGMLARVPATAAPGATAFVALALSSAELLVGHDGYYLADSQSLFVAVGIGVALIATAFLLDRVRRGARGDAAFWLHAVGLGVFGVLAAKRIADAPVELMIWLPLALALGAIGLRFDRRIYLGTAALALLAFPVLAFDHGPERRLMCFSSIGVATVVVAVGAAWLRTYYTTAWLKDPARQVARTVWC